MNKEILNLIKESVNRNGKDHIYELYRTIWINTLIQFREKNNQAGIYFWIKKTENDYYSLFYFSNNGKTEKMLKMNDDEKEAVEIMLLDDGFDVKETKNNNTILMIEKDIIIAFANNCQEEDKKNSFEETTYTKKMPITPFTETRRRKYE